MSFIIFFVNWIIIVYIIIIFYLMFLYKFVLRVIHE
jgi:hypothetical protein